MPRRVPLPECGATAQCGEARGAVQRRTERLAGCRLVQVRPSSFSSQFILLKPTNSLQQSNTLLAAADQKPLVILGVAGICLKRQVSHSWRCRPCWIH